MIINNLSKKNKNYKLACIYYILDSYNASHGHAHIHVDIYVNSNGEMAWSLHIYLYIHWSYSLDFVLRQKKQPPQY